MSDHSCIRVVGARQHNLKNVHVDLPRGAMTVITGMSGSGKSSLAFDTLYAEGQRRYVESLSAYARQFLEQMPKPNVERIVGLCPTIAIEQRSSSPGPRSTVATSTEIHDFLRVLFARVGVPRCWRCDKPIVRQSTSQMVETVLTGALDQRIMVLAPLVLDQRGAHKSILERITKEGFVRARIDGDVLAIEDVGELKPTRKHTIEVVVDRLKISPGIRQRLADSIELATRLAGGRIIIALENDGVWTDERFSASLGCPDHIDVRIAELSPQLFSFNGPTGACPSCHGLGTTMQFDTELVVPDRKRSLNDGAIAPWRNQGKRLNDLYARTIKEFCSQFGVLPDTPVRNMDNSEFRILLHGTSPKDEAQFGCSFEGVLPNLSRRWDSTQSASAKQKLHSFLDESPCEACTGQRLRTEALCVKIADRNIADIASATIREALEFFQSLSFSGESAVIAETIVSDICSRLHFLCEAGVGYLTLDRASSTLSGGEWQRIRLATQIGAGLSGVCYVLDEPTIGLHPRDSRRLVKILRNLSAQGNTVVVVEHDEEVICGADHMIDIGPGAGEQGGQVVAEGAVTEVLRSSKSMTAQYLTGARQIEIPNERREPDWRQCVEVCGASANNLKDVTVRFPLGRFVCVTGVSGSGKSTLVSHVLVRALKRQIQKTGPRAGEHKKIVGASKVDRVIEVDQSPIGRTSRSNPATYIGVFDLIRKLYAQTREAKIRGYGPARFSFNVKGGRCELCEGQGVKRIAMHFMPDVFVRCVECNGKRFNRETLDIRFRGKNIADVLAMRVSEALQFFENFANIRHRFQVLTDVGMGYITLGQSANTLSGGEAQRIKLAAELHRSGDGHTLYVLDEPTTGLHFADIQNLLEVLNRLADRGQTILCIEHNMEVIKVADWVIDLGPEGGEKGGEVVAEGPPEIIAKVAQSHTGRFLANRLKNGPLIPAASK